MQRPRRVRATRTRPATAEDRLLAPPIPELPLAQKENVYLGFIQLNFSQREGSQQKSKNCNYQHLQHQQHRYF